MSGPAHERSAGRMGMKSALFHGLPGVWGRRLSPHLHAWSLHFVPSHGFAPPFIYHRRAGSLDELIGLHRKQEEDQGAGYAVGADSEEEAVEVEVAGSGGEAASSAGAGATAATAADAKGSGNGSGSGAAVGSSATGTATETGDTSAASHAHAAGEARRPGGYGKAAPREKKRGLRWHEIIKVSYQVSLCDTPLSRPSEPCSHALRLHILLPDTSGCCPEPVALALARGP